MIKLENSLFGLGPLVMFSEFGRVEFGHVEFGQVEFV